MKRILLLDTSVGSLNMGDEIIGRSIEMNWRELFSSNYVMRLAAHSPMYTPVQYLLYKRKLSIFKGAEIKFLCGTNALYTNMLRPLPTWNINYLNCGMVAGTVCLGVGAGVNSSSVNLYTRALYRKVLSHEVVHSVRDERTKQLLEQVGLRAWNTGCPTLWGLTPEHCEAIARTKGDEVVFTLTSYHPDPRKDRAMIDVLRRHYSRLHFWPQSINDLDYLHSLDAADDVEIVTPSLAGFREVLDRGVDYVGNRLHGGIFALQRRRRAIIVAIDYRAREMAKNYSLPLVERDSIENDLADMVESSWATRIQGLDFDLIETWKAQFGVGKP
ncbi:capsular biosynthesis protein [Actinomyces naeslundii]|uniref:Capsular biosynthesis protein n=1 Tax=Actinomyces naeslundii TaxID=1655 RepID=A0ABX3F383_ACTNA|nr:polysaccharide pyruvyl transferase family protein [Actinomyces naeslundii]OLO83454.1 capsular biosynthesis protein [Actinomyces naeslundii]OLO92433.1 capsular biosynthesis protein [Actinomyces naeslundii]